MHAEWDQAAATETSSNTKGNVANPGTKAFLDLQSMNKSETRKLTIRADIDCIMVVGRSRLDV